MKTKNIQEKIYTDIQNQIVEMLENAKLTKTQKPWFGVGLEFANNPLSNTIYNGFNQFYLSLLCDFRGYKVNRWLTFKQIQSLNGKVKKGSKACPVTYYQTFFKDAKGNKLSDIAVQELKKTTGKSLSELNILSSAFVRFFYVFNVEQVAELPQKYYDIDTVILNDVAKIEIAETVLINSNAKITNKLGDSAHYNLVDDEITLPEIGQFTNSLDYYSVAFHELSHWTGATSRLNRTFGKQFGNEDYAFEELIAELSAALICGSIQITRNFTNNATYIDSWLKVFKKDIKVFFKAAAHAQKAADFILAFKESKQLAQKEAA